MRVRRYLSPHVGTRDSSVVFHGLVWNKVSCPPLHLLGTHAWKNIQYSSASASPFIKGNGRGNHRCQILRWWCASELTPSIVAASILPAEPSLGHQGTCLLCYEMFGLAVARAGLTFYSFNSSALVTKTAFDFTLKKFLTTSYHWYLYQFRVSVFFLN